ncbi:MAG TPA: inorganic phosphate transporter [Thermoanaerobaculia bacterium]|nr:inorganic phosphate transporter [Thermoanaerobaculia bacterium]
MIFALLFMMLALAFANGANDVSRGIATLVGSGVSSYRRAVVWGSLCTLLGALAAAVVSRALLATFTGTGILLDPISDPRFLLSIALGAVAWLGIATLTGMPVSTTHSLAGALIGSAFIASSGIVWSALAMKIVIPLAASPLLALALLMLVLPRIRSLAGRFDHYCVCLERTDLAAVPAVGMSFSQPMPAVDVGTDASCTRPVARAGVVDSLHWISVGATSFFRGMNDAPKVMALGIGGAALLGWSAMSTLLLVAVSMGAGSLLGGFRVTRTLAERITPIAPSDGLAANLVTSSLVGLASFLALPVSTTHVSSGAIIGIGVSRRGRDVRWKTVAEMMLAWIVTLPASALLAATAYRLLA